MAYNCQVLDGFGDPSPDLTYTYCSVWSPDASKWQVMVDALATWTWQYNCSGTSEYDSDGYQTDSPGNYFSSVAVTTGWWQAMNNYYYELVQLWGTAKHKDTSVSNTVSQSGGPWENSALSCQI